MNSTWNNIRCAQFLKWFIMNFKNKMPSKTNIMGAHSSEPVLLFLTLGVYQPRWRGWGICYPKASFLCSRRVTCSDYARCACCQCGPHAWGQEGGLVRPQPAWPWHPVPATITHTPPGKPTLRHGPVWTIHCECEHIVGMLGSWHIFTSNTLHL